MRALITGSGNMGRAIAVALEARGDEVAAVAGRETGYPAPVEITLPTAGVDGIMLKDAAEAATDNNGTDVAIPATLAVDGDVTVMVYFDPAEGFTATQIDIWGRMVALP